MPEKSVANWFICIAGQYMHVINTCLKSTLLHETNNEVRTVIWYDQINKYISLSYLLYIIETAQKKTNIIERLEASRKERCDKLYCD